MIDVLADHNIEWHAAMLLETLDSLGWLGLFPIRLHTFATIGLPVESSDRMVWHFAQDQQMILLTANRNRDLGRFPRANDPRSKCPHLSARADHRHCGAHRR